MQRLTGGSVVCLVLMLGLAAPDARAEDWPCYNGDAARSATTREKLPLPLKKAWEYVPAQAPRPAWPEPGKEAHRMPFDYAPQPVVADGKVFIGSSADDTVRALDVRTGKVQWRFTTGGPIRFAPAFAKGKLYVASDDGYLYCLQAATGKLLWQFHAAPGDDQLLGNGRMISRWPLRAGVIVEGGIVYTAAGMWPSEGIYLFALSAATGKPVWTNDSSGDMYISTPHGRASAFTGVTPQGYMAAAGNVLLVPCGRSVPAGFDRRTGKLLYYHPGSSQFEGGAWLTAAGDIYLNPKHPRAGVVPPFQGEADPLKTQGLMAYRASDGRRVAQLMGKHRAIVAGGVMYATGSGTVHAIDLKTWLAGGKLESTAKWSAPHGRAYCLAATKNAVVVGGRGTVTAFDLGKGRQLWQAKVDGQVRGLAIAEGRLVATTNKGTLIVFDKGTRRVKRVVEKVTWKPTHGAAGPILKATGVSAGYALVIGDTRLAEALASRSKLHVVSLIDDAGKAERERERLVAAGVNGTRLVVQGRQDLTRMPYADYFANLIVVAGEPKDLGGKDLYRLLRPCGGVMVFDKTPQAVRQRLVGEAGIPTSEIQSGGTRVVRGRLPGAGEWRMQGADGGKTAVGTEARVRLPVRVLWFGGPGPNRMMDRHHASPAPLYVNGRAFVLAVHHVIAFDAYNGRELWSRKLMNAGKGRARSGGSNFCADESTLFVAIDTKCHRLDQATGKTVRTYAVPKVKTRPHRDLKKWGGPRWGYLSVTDELVLGSIIETKDLERSTAVFALAKKDGPKRWAFAAKRQIDNSAIAHSADRMFVLDATPRGNMYSAKRRGWEVPAEGELVALDLAGGKPRWRQADVPLIHRVVQYAKGVVLVEGNAAYDAAEGTKLWRHSGADAPYKGTTNTRLPIVYNNWVIVEPRAYDLRTGRPRMTTDIVTGKERPWQFTRAYGCNDPVGCQGLLLFRSGMEGIFDFEQDATTTYAGVRPGCGVTTIPAGGLLIHAEGSSGCTCGYNYQTSLALAPTAPGRDLWYVFQGETADAPVKHVSLNLGAPGDRRDGEGTPWLGYPRPGMWGACPVPVRIAAATPRGYYRPAQAGRTDQTDKPWLYNSGMTGPIRIIADLVLQRSLVVPRVARGPKIDAALGDACWKGAKALPFRRNSHLSAPRTTVFACRDEKHIYFAYRRDAVRKGRKWLPFVAAQKGENAKVWLDDSLELMFVDKKLQECVQIGVSCAGGRIIRRTLLGRGRWIDPVKWRKKPVPDPTWRGKWASAVKRTEREWLAEVAVPLTTLADAGLDVDSLQLNVVSRHQGGRGAPYIYMDWFVSREFNLPEATKPLMDMIEKPVSVPNRQLRMRLHFAEPDDRKPGERVFDVVVQGKTVLKRFDIVKAAGAPRRAVVKEITGVVAGEKLTVELKPASGSTAPPLLCAIEIRAED